MARWKINKIRLLRIYYNLESNKWLLCYSSSQWHKRLKTVRLRYPHKKSVVTVLIRSANTFFYSLCVLSSEITGKYRPNLIICLKYQHRFGILQLKTEPMYSLAKYLLSPFQILYQMWNWQMRLPEFLAGQGWQGSPKP